MCCAILPAVWYIYDMNKVILTVFALLCVAFVWGQDEATVAAGFDPAYVNFPSALGASYGPISGSGLHYHQWRGNLGYQATAGVLYVPFDQESMWNLDLTLDYNLGGEVQRRVYGDAFSNWLTGSLYLFAGGNHRGYIPVVLVQEEVYDNNDTPDDFSDDTYIEPVYDTGTFQAELTLGAGIGIEVILFQHFSIPVEVGYGATWTATEPDLAQAFMVDILVQAAFRYRY